MASATSSLEESVGTTKKKNVRFTFVCAIFASMASAIFGYEVAVMSGASLFMKKDLKITDVQLEILMGVVNLYSIIGSFAAGRTSDWIGRRYTVVLTYVLTATAFFAGALLTGLASSYAVLMAGQFVTGIGAGYALMIPPVYTAEISPASGRGFLASFPEVFINLGILLSYLSSYAFARLPLRLGWRAMICAGAAPSVALMALVALGMPESPRWLVMKGRIADAMAVLEKISDTPEEAADRLADIKAAAGVIIPAGDDAVVTGTSRKIIGGQKEEEEQVVWKELVLSPTPAVRRILLSALGVLFFQQASGIDSVILYSPHVFKSAGMAEDNRLLGATCAVGASKMLFTLVSTFFLDRVGRRPLLLGSTAGVVLSLAGLGAGLLAAAASGSGPGRPWAAGLCVASSLAYVGFFSAGLGPIAWVYSSEVFPLRLRAAGSALGVACNRLTSGVVTMTFLSLSRAITPGGTFFLYGGIAAIGWVFFFACLPETRGRTLEEMGTLFGVTGTTGTGEDDDVDDGRHQIEHVRDMIDGA